MRVLGKKYCKGWFATADGDGVLFDYGVRPEAG